LVQTINEEDLPTNFNPSKRRLSQDLRIPYRKKHHLYTRKPASNAKPEEKKL